MRLVADIETNALDDFKTLGGLEVCHCIVAMDLDDEHPVALVYHDDPLFEREGSIAQGLELLTYAEEVWGHNWIGFDSPALRKLYPNWPGEELVVDTQGLALLLWSDTAERDWRRINRGVPFPKQMAGRQSLESWGLRLGEHKDTDFKGKQTAKEAFAKLTQRMIDYCIQDVRTNHKLARFQLSRWPENDECVQLEMDFKRNLNVPQSRGITIDQEALDVLESSMQARVAELRDELGAAFPPFTDHYVTPVRKEKKTRQVAFNPGSRLHLARAFGDRYGWKPEVFTAAGRPKMDEPILEGLPFPEADLALEFLLTDKKLSMVAGAKNKKGGKGLRRSIYPDGRVRGRINHIGTVTHRCSHSDPNKGQVPKVGKPFGAEFRRVFIPSIGWVLIGCDASGLELRLLSHFLARWDGGAYARAVTEGNSEDGTDAHTLNQKALGADSRDIAKEWFYAWLYGAGNPKLGKIMGCSPRKAKQKAERFISETPGLGELKALCMNYCLERGWLPGFDGRHLPTRHAHASLNTLLQGNGAVVMKKATNLLISSLEAEQIEAYLLLHVHDEFQLETQPADVDRVKQLAEDSIRDAGVHFNLRCPMEGVAQSGPSWEATH